MLSLDTQVDGEGKHRGQDISMKNDLKKQHI